MTNVHNPEQHASLTIRHANGFLYQYRLAETEKGTYVIEYQLENDSQQPITYDTVTPNDLQAVIMRAALITLLLGYSSYAVRRNVGGIL